MPPSILTEAVHAGERAERPDFTPVSTPLYRSVGYVYDNMETLDAVFGDRRPGYVYTRYGTPTVAALEKAVAVLEGGEAAIAASSGMAAIHLALLAAGGLSGASIVAARDCYGATYALLRDLLTSQGVGVRFVDITDLGQVEKALTDAQASALVLETISNPLLKVPAIPAIAEMAHAVGALVIVDNTFATPCLCRPLQFGADFVVHSSTKYFGGHGDVMGGVVVTSTERRARLFQLIKMIGCNLGPDEAWLTLRGLKTLPLRMRQHCHNAAAVAAWLAQHPRVAEVHYPGLPSHPQHAVASHLFGDRGYGGMVGFSLRDAGREDVFRFLQSLRLILPATTLGDVYSLVLYPAMSSHRALSPEERAQVGIGEGLIRLSVGIEGTEDIIADLQQALGDGAGPSL
jgi:cystathionine beta-lyase/cystathionine gamma-synthase